MTRSLWLLLSVVVALTGCRDALTEPDPDPVGPPLVPGANVAPLYIKGPDALRLHDQAPYRAEPIQDPRLHHYAWSTYGLGDLDAEAVDPAGLDRLIRARATEEGTVLLIARAYDADGNRIARGTKEITITP